MISFLNNITDIDSIIFIILGLFISLVFNFILLKRYKSIELCIALTVFTLSTYILTILPAGKTIQNFLIIIVFILFTLYFIVNVDLSKIVLLNLSKLNFDNYLILLLLFIYFVSAVIFNFKDFKTVFGFAKTITFIVCLVFYCYFFPAFYSKNPKLLKVSLNYLVFLGLITGIFGILFYIFNFNEIPSATNASLSFFRHPNTVAFIYTLTFPIILYSLLFEGKNISIMKKLFYLISISVIFISLLLTLSRAGYIAVSVSSVILLLYHKNKIVLILIVLFVVIFSTFFLSLILSKGSVSTISRIGLLYAAVEMLRSSLNGFLWGFGSSSVFETFTEFKYQLGPLVEDVAYPHNFILFFIMQFGIFAFIVAAIYAFQLLYQISKILKAKFEQNKFLILPFSIVIGLLFQSLLEDTILFPDFFVFHIFFFYFGILVFSRKNDGLQNINFNSL